VQYEVRLALCKPHRVHGAIRRMPECMPISVPDCRDTIGLMGWVYSDVPYVLVNFRSYHLGGSRRDAVGTLGE
jgi:hypothetical protein